MDYKEGTFKQFMEALIEELETAFEQIGLWSCFGILYPQNLPKLLKELREIWHSGPNDTFTQTYLKSRKNCPV